MSKKRRKRKRAPKPEMKEPTLAESGHQAKAYRALAESGGQGKGYREVVTLAASELDRRFGRAWRDDPDIVAEFGRVIMEECEGQGIVVTDGEARLQEKVFGSDLPAP